MTDAAKHPFPEELCAVITATDDPSRYTEYKTVLGPLNQRGIQVPVQAYATAAEALEPLCVIILDPPGIFPEQNGAEKFFGRLNEHNGAVISGATAADEQQRAGTYVIIPIIIDSDPKINNREFYERQGARYLPADRKAQLTPEGLLTEIVTVYEYHFQQASALKGQQELSERHQRMAGPWKGAPL